MKRERQPKIDISIVGGELKQIDVEGRSRDIEALIARAVRIAEQVLGRAVPAGDPPPQSRQGKEERRGEK